MFERIMTIKKLHLRDGSKIAIIGGGPAGSFANFAIRYAKKLGINIQITIFESRDFSQRGPRGCNMSAAVIAGTLHAKLIKDGIELPENIVRQEIKGYYFQTKEYGIELHDPESNENASILAVYRGNGPLYSKHTGNLSFDDYLLKHTIKHGANVIHEPVQALKLSSNIEIPAKIIYGRPGLNKEMEADLVVGAFGINATMINKVERLNFGYVPPKTVRTCQMEIPLSNSFVKESFNDNIFVFALGLKPFRFASMVPKRNYVTVSLVGNKDLSKKDLLNFLNHPVVRGKLPHDWKMPDRFCMCMPKIALIHAINPFTDRFVIVGDASISRIYKNGLESAYMTSQLAAQAAFERGISKEDFNMYYYKPARKLLEMDNMYGELLMQLSDFVTKRNWLVKARLSYVESKKDPWMSNHLNRLLWNMVTGYTPYKEIFLQAFNPVFQIQLIPVTLKAFIKENL
ncbi:MAG: putative geranylgeranyl reductase [Candidatus Scalindua rubra]|uniref:Putative geranylgeranyl reductase n=1 Tax=Candidatus Scalindua rubra TaxID=1872076 RepID=A0A1E3X8N0_9BACT|nr:MAG: putative geranylgeranyl reductase [Candidatus Scalindua rubra]